MPKYSLKTIDLETFERLYRDSTRTVADIAENDFGVSDRLLNKFRRKHDLTTRQELGLVAKKTGKKKASRQVNRWLPPKGVCRPVRPGRRGGCPFFTPCHKLRFEPGIVGVGCEIVFLTDNPGRFEPPDATRICYKSPVMAGAYE